MISLKAYNLEIEQLIDNGMYDVAIAHSIHILSTYPKCIDSYRNLGKSLLELKKYSEALDVFSRVLSSIPDDFISHVGLSIIFEDQKNLDLAIWHMEQAFDVQPSNLAIQDELKRLFGLRDGEQPSKIRLTRGALVRMYARGELFQQAITEILSILEEDPRRIDLEVILAKMYYSSGVIEESEANCSRILEKFPYCFEANRIHQQIQINKNNLEAAAIFKNRLISLDPYYQFAASPFSENEIPESKVQLEKLNFIPTNNIETQIPDWLEEINVSPENQTNESFNWLNNLADSENTNNNIIESPFSVTNQALDNIIANESMKADDGIPEWLKTAGWKSESVFATSEEDTQNSSTYLESQPSTSDLSESNTLEVIQSTVTNDDLTSLFTELKEGKMTNENLTPDENDETHFPPSDWMSQFSNSDSTTTSESSVQDFPDWLKNFQAEEPQLDQAPGDMPDWLKNLKPETEIPVQISDEIQEATSLDESNLELTPELNNFEQEKIVEDVTINNDSSTSISELEDGGENIDLSKTENNDLDLSQIKTGELKPIPSDDQIPDWVKSVLVNQDSNVQPLMDQESDPSLDISPAVAKSSEMDVTIQESSETTINIDEGIISQQTNDELLDWLRGLKTDEEPSSQISDVLDSSESFDSIAIDNVANKNIENQSSEELHLTENIDVNGLNEIQKEEMIEEPDQASNDSEITFAVVGDMNNTITAESEYTEYTNELTEISTSSETIDEIPAAQLIAENEFESITNVSTETIFELLSKNDFENIGVYISNYASQGREISSLISAITSAADQFNNNFAYWQCLGDIYSKNNQLNEALIAYQKSEDILIKTIST